MRILALVGKNVDEREVISLLGPGDFELARYGKLSRGVRRLEKFPADTVLLVPNAEDDTWPRAVRRIREEHHVRSVVVLPDDRKRETGLDAGAFDVFRWDSVTSDDLERSFRHLARQVELEDRLCQTRTMFDWVEETGRLGSWSMDEQGRTIWSRGARRILNDTDGKLTTAFDSVRSFVHPEDLEIYEQANKATFDQGWPLDFEYRVRVGEDDLRYLHLHRRVEHGRSGDVFHAFGLLRDVTAEREFENFLFRRDGVLQVVAAFAARFLRESDWEGGVDSGLADLGKAMDVTRAYVFRKSEVVAGQENLSMAHEWAAPGMASIKDLPEMRGQPYDVLYKRLIASLLDRKVVACHVRNLHAEERRFLQQTGVRSLLLVPVFSGGDWWGFMGFSEHREERDWLPVEIESVTLVADIFGSAILRRKMEDLLMAANRRAEDANRAKSRFLANMSHEIRTPLSGILGMAEMLADMQLSGEHREYLDMIRDAARSLLTIINDVLDLSRIEAQKMELVPVDFELRSMLERTLKPFATLAKQKGIAFRHSVSGQVDRVVNGDADRLAQVVRNLVGNAIKFTRQGYVEITVEVAERRPGRSCLRFTVRDSGEGIPRDKLEAVFETFVQGDSSVHKRHQGTGLGLAISRDLVMMMGGELGVESEPDRGSIFSFTAWFRESESRQPALPESSAVSPSRRLRVLLVEDNLLNQRFVTHFLTRAGHRVTVAGNGMEALETLRRDGRDIDIVLMDIQMPEMGGIEATAAIRASDGSRFDPGIPVVALTAYAMKGDRERMLEAGMDEYVSKPIDIPTLVDTMNRCLEERSVAGETCPLVEEEAVHFDMDGLIDRFQGDMGLLKEILGLFLTEAEEYIAKLDQSLARGDAVALGAALHSVTNIASHVLALDIVRTARCLERRCSQGRAGEVREDIKKLRAGFATLVDIVRRRAETL